MGLSIKSITKPFKKVFKKILKPFAKIFQSKAFKIISIAATVVGIGAAMYSAYTALTAGSGSFWANVGSNISKMATDAGTWIKELPSKVGQSLTKMGEGIAKFAKDPMGAMKSGMDSLTGAGEAAQSAGKTAELNMPGITDAAKEGVGDAAANAATGSIDTAGINTEAIKTAGMDKASLATDTTAFNPDNVYKLGDSLKTQEVVGNLNSAGGAPTNLTNVGSQGLLDRTMDGLVKYAPVAQVVGSGVAAATGSDEGEALEEKLKYEKRMQAGLDKYLDSYTPDGGAGAIANSGIIQGIQSQGANLEGLLTRSTAEPARAIVRRA